MAFPAGSVLAQQVDQRHEESVLSQIEDARSDGQLSTDQGLLYTFYALYDRERLPQSYRVDGNAPIKCGTPALMEFQQEKENLSPATVSEIERLSQRQTQQQSDETHISSSGNFAIHYDTSGDDAPPQEDSNNSGVPDYVEEVAAAADSSYRHEVENLGYTDPLLPAAPYDITILNLQSVYGQTIVTAGGATTEIEIENDFAENFPPNDHPDGDQIGAVYATVAHELKHAIQYANNEWEGSAGSFDWSEMDATLMEEVVYENVNDYYNYLPSSNSIFNTPQDGIPGAYWHVSWSLFFEEYFGSVFWVDVWQEIKEEPDRNFLDAIISQVRERDENFSEIFAESHLWHYASGRDLSPANYGFEERLEYPDPSISTTLSGEQEIADNSLSMGSSGARYVSIRPTGNEDDELAIVLEGDENNNRFTAGAIAYFNDGSTRIFTETSVNQAGQMRMETPWNWSDISEVGLVAVNINEDENLRINVGTESYALESAKLEQNYPNPFREKTTIEFTLPRESDVQLKIYDITGRLVQTLVDETLPDGSHSEDFDPRGLASGIYIYQLTTDEGTDDRKMTFIK